MDRYRFGRRADYGGRSGRRRRWPRSRAAGCLLWIVLLVVLLVVLLIVLSVMFGGFQKGTQVKGLGPGRTYSSGPSLVGVLVALLLAGLLTLVSWVLEIVSSRQPSPGPPPSPSGTAAQRLASADPAGSSSQISRDPPHTAEAARRLSGRVCPV